MKCGTKRMKAGGPTSMDRAKYGKGMAKVMNQTSGMKKGGVVRGMGAATKGAGKGPWG